MLTTEQGQTSANMTEPPVEKPPRNVAKRIRKNPDYENDSNSSAPNPNNPAPRSKQLNGLVIVPTPIGNLDDITLRAIHVLQNADFIACEDTRVTSRLLTALNIRTELKPYHEHNAAKMRPVIITAIRSGAMVALVSDAGTPLVSDPGYKLLQECIAAGVNVTALPGPSAVMNGLVLSGLPTDQFHFAGFLPNKTGARQRALRTLTGSQATLIFFESARRLSGSLDDMLQIFGDRNAAVIREMTKLYEEVRRDSLAQLQQYYSQNGPPKGEIVIVVSGRAASELNEVDINEQLRHALQTMGVRDAVVHVAAISKKSRRALYQRALELSREKT